MMNRLVLFVRALLCALVCLGGLVAVAPGCSQDAIQQAQDPATLEQLSEGVVLRQKLCGSLPALAGYVPEEALAKAKTGCAMGDTVQTIAAALGGCYVSPVPAEPAAPEPAPAQTSPGPVPDAGPPAPAPASPGGA